MKTYTRFFNLIFMAIIFLCGISFAQMNTAQSEIEKKFDSYLNPADLNARLKILSAQPHHVGSP